PSSCPPRPLHSSPTRRSSDLAWRDRLFVTAGLRRDATTRFHVDDPATVYPSLGLSWRGPVPSGGFPLTGWRLRAAYGAAGREAVDRKSTRLNSSHGSISYAVF